MNKVYAITYRRYMYTPGPGVDWQLTTEECKNIMADNMITAVDFLRQKEPNRIEIQSTQMICTVQHIAELKVK